MTGLACGGATGNETVKGNNENRSIYPRRDSSPSFRRLGHKATADKISKATSLRDDLGISSMLLISLALDLQEDLGIVIEMMPWPGFKLLGTSSRLSRARQNRADPCVLPTKNESPPRCDHRHWPDLVPRARLRRSRARPSSRRERRSCHARVGKLGSEEPSSWRDRRPRGQAGTHTSSQETASRNVGSIKVLLHCVPRRCKGCRPFRNRRAI